MREIKFRGKLTCKLDDIPEDFKEDFKESIKDGFIYGYLIGKDVIVGEIVEWDEEYFATEFWAKVDPATVGQYTGLKDKNGVEIYEGDIVELTNTYKGMNTKSIVEIDLIDFTFAGKWKEEYSPSGYMYNPLGCYNFPIVTIEVIGNIHDNLEWAEE